MGALARELGGGCRWRDLHQPAQREAEKAPHSVSLHFSAPVEGPASDNTTLSAPFSGPCSAPFSATFSAPAAPQR